MRRFLLAFAALTSLALPASAAVPAAVPQVASLQHQDDGAEYVWQVFCNSGLRYSYIPASQFPNSTRFLEVEKPQTGDIAWWPDFVAIFNGQTSQYITSNGFVKLADISVDGSAPRYYRMKIFPGEQIGKKAEQGVCERSLL